MYVHMFVCVNVGWVLVYCRKRFYFVILVVQNTTQLVVS
jgi:hypothetical protein